MSTVCHWCRKAGADTPDGLRPYGPGGAYVCHACTVSDPERNAAAVAAYQAQLAANMAISPTRVVVVDEDGPRPYDPAQDGRVLAEGTCIAIPCPPYIETTLAATPYNPVVNPYELCPCGHPWIRHDVEEYSGDGSETCCVEGCAQNGCPGREGRS